MALDDVARLTDEQITYVLFLNPDPGPPPAGRPAGDFREDFITRLVEGGRSRAEAEVFFARSFPDHPDGRG